MHGGYVLQCSNCGARNRVPHARAADKGRCAKCSAVLIASHSMAMPTTDSGWARDVIGSDAPVIVELWSANCNVCTQYDLAVKRMAARFYGQARVLQMNVDENPKTMALYKITGVPTVLLFNKGELLRTMVGPQGEQGIRAALGLD